MIEIQVMVTLTISKMVTVKLADDQPPGAPDFDTIHAVDMRVEGICDELTEAGWGVSIESEDYPEL